MEHIKQKWEHALTADERCARYEMALHSIQTIASWKEKEDGDDWAMIQEIAKDATNVPITIEVEE